MTFDRIDRMVREANPVPDPYVLEGIDLSDLQDLRRNGMQTESIIQKEVRRFREPARRPRPIGQRVAAFGAVALVVAMVAFLPAASDWISGSGPVGVAERYIEARMAYDAGAAREVLSEDVELSEAPYVASVSDLDPAFEYLEIVGIEFDEYECSASPEALESEPVLVRCDYVFDSRMSRALGVEHVPGLFNVLVEGGEIIHLQHVFNYDVYATQVFEVFMAWLEENHPGAVESMWQDAPNGTRVFAYDTASFEELDRYVTEFEQAQS